ncbi:hypothetical protein D3C84_530660 [compost metagenome]
MDDYRAALRAVKSCLLFLSNFDFAKSGNYFDAPLHENWLLHTWSLSVEWQFYLVFPIILISLFRFIGEQKTKLALVLMAVCSLIASAFVTNTDPVFAFYMLPTRAWEMIAGGLVFAFPLVLTRNVRFAFEGLGLVYLWHWPIVVFLYTCGLLTSALHVSLGIVLSFVLGACSFYLVESKVKKIIHAPRALFKYGSAAVSVVALAAIGGSVVKNHPQVRFAFVEQSQPEYTSKLYTQECYPSAYGASDCKLGSGDVSVILFGDSHAQSTAAAIQVENKKAALGWARGGCPTLLSFQMRDKELENKCQGFIKEKMATLRESHPGVPVVLFSRTALYADPSRNNSFRVYFGEDVKQTPPAFAESFTQEYVKTVCSIAEQRAVYIVRPVPEMPFSVFKGLNLQVRIFGSRSDISFPLSEYTMRNKLALAAIDAAASQCNARVIDPVPYLCPNGRCMGSKNGVPLYFDDNHLVDAGNEQLDGLFKDFFKTI